MPTRLVTEEAVLEAIDIWATDFRVALMDRNTYAAKNVQFREDARIIERQLQGFKYAGTTIFNYVSDILADTARRGYVDSIHYPALFTGFKQWATEIIPPPSWLPPPGNGKSSGPPPREQYTKGKAVLFLEGTMEVVPEEEEEEEEEQVPVAGKSSKGKGKEAAKTQKRADGPKKSAEPQRKSGGKAGPAYKSASVVPSESGDEQVLEVNNPPCKKCSKNGTPCVLQPEPSKSSSKDKRSVRSRLACVPCRDSKNRCEFPPIPGAKPRSPSPEGPSVAPVDDDAKEKVVPAPTKPKRTRKKPAVDTSSIPADVAEHIATLERRNHDLQEEVEDLSARFVRLESDVHQSQIWTTGRIISVWEGFQQMGERMTRSMNAMVQVVGEDHAKHKRLVELMEEAHLCLGIPFPGWEAPFPPALTPAPGDLPPPSDVPPAFLEGMAIVRQPASNLVDPEETSPANHPSTPPLRPSAIPRTPPNDTDAGEEEDGEVTGADLGNLPLPPLRRSGSKSVASTPVVARIAAQKRAMSAVPEGAEDDNRPKKQRLV